MSKYFRYYLKCLNDKKCVLFGNESLKFDFAERKIKINHGRKYISRPQSIYTALKFEIFYEFQLRLRVTWFE